jgi:hypothetical protein
MLKYLFYLILTLHICDAVACARYRDDEGEINPSHHNSFNNKANILASRHLDPLSLSRFLMTNKELGNAIRKQTDVYDIKPILLAELLVEIPNSLKVMDVESYIMHICQRLPYSFNKIFGAHMTWQDFPGKLQEQTNLLRAWQHDPDYVSAYRITEELFKLYTTILSNSNENGSVLSFLEDNQERRDAITYMRPRMLLIYLTSILKDSVGGEQNMKLIIGTRDRLQAFQCYETSVREGKILLNPQVNFTVFEPHLWQVVWKSRIYQNAISFDFNAEVKYPETFLSDITSSLGRLKLITAGGIFSLLPLQDLAQTTSRWLTEMVGMMGPMHFSPTQTKELFNNWVKDYIYQFYYNMVKLCANSLDNINSLEAQQRHVSYRLQEAALAKESEDQAAAYDKAGDAKWREVKLLSADTDTQKKAEVLALAASYFMESASLHTNSTKKGCAYKNAGYLLAKLGKLNDASDLFQKCIDFYGNHKMEGLVPDTLEIMENALQISGADGRYIKWIKEQRNLSICNIDPRRDNK